MVDSAMFSGPDFLDESATEPPLVDRRRLALSDHGVAGVSRPMWYCSSNSGGGLEQPVVIVRPDPFEGRKLDVQGLSLRRRYLTMTPAPTLFHYLERFDTRRIQRRLDSPDHGVNALTQPFATTG